MSGPDPGVDTIRLIAALVYVAGGQVVLTAMLRREAPASYSVWEDPATGALVLVAPADRTDDTEVEQCHKQQSSS